jgi:hypothetical protein
MSLLYAIYGFVAGIVFHVKKTILFMNQPAFRNPPRGNENLSRVLNGSLIHE